MIIRKVRFPLSINYQFTSSLSLISYLKKYFSDFIFPLYLLCFVLRFFHLPEDDSYIRWYKRKATRQRWFQDAQLYKCKDWQIVGNFFIHLWIALKSVDKVILPCNILHKGHFFFHVKKHFFLFLKLHLFILPFKMKCHALFNYFQMLKYKEL